VFLLSLELVSVGGILVFDILTGWQPQRVQVTWPSIIWLPPTLYELILFLMVLFKSMRCRNLSENGSRRLRGGKRIMGVLLRDQAIYFAVLTFLSAMNAIAWSFHISSFYLFFSRILYPYAFGFPVVVGSRMLFNLKEEGQRRTQASYRSGVLASRDMGMEFRAPPNVNHFRSELGSDNRDHPVFTDAIYSQTCVD